MRSRYFGPARPITDEKDWLLDYYKSDSYSRDQSKPPEIYVRPTYVIPTPPEPIPPDPTPIYYTYNYIDEQGYPYDLALGREFVDLEGNTVEEFYDLAWPFSFSFIYQQGFPYDLQDGRNEIDLEEATENIIYELNG